VAQDGGAAGRCGQAQLQGAPAHVPTRLRLSACQPGTDTRTLQTYLGHRNIQHTVRYTELSPTRFKNLWRD
jgi:site-specific recombinase XerC